MSPPKKRICGLLFVFCLPSFSVCMCTHLIVDEVHFDDVEGIDELIARHKEALKRIEDSKSFFASREKKATPGPKLPFAERVRTHLRTHGHTWSNVLFTGWILILSLRLVALRRELGEAKEKLEQRNETLKRENTKMRGYVDRVEGSWEAILNEIRSSGRRSGSVVERVEKIMQEIRSAKAEEETKSVEPPKEVKKPKSFFI